MCHWVSFVITKDCEWLCFGDGESHAGIEAGWELKPGEYRECEWRRDDDGDSLVVRVEDGEDKNVFRAAILADFPTRRALLAGVTHGQAGSTGFVDKSSNYIIRCDARGRRHGLQERVYLDGAWRTEMYCHGIMRGEWVQVLPRNEGGTTRGRYINGRLAD